MSLADQSTITASTSNISRAASIAYVVIYALAGIAVFIRLLRVNANRFAHVCYLLLALIRIGTFVVRAVVSTLTPSTKPTYTGPVLAATILLVAGFLLIIEAIISLTLKWTLLLRATEVKRRTSFRLHQVSHLLLGGIIALGVVGAVQQVGFITHPNTLTTSAWNTAKALRTASGSLFLGILGVEICLIGWISRFMVIKVERSVNTRKTAWLLMGLTICCAVEAGFKLWSSIKYDGWVVREGAVGAMVVLPEVLALILISTVDLGDLGHVRFVWQSRFEQEPVVETFGRSKDVERA